MMKKYIYQRLRLKGEYAGDPVLIEDLNRYGQRGWELKGNLESKHDGYSALFMKEAITSRDERDEDN